MVSRFGDKTHIKGYSKIQKYTFVQSCADFAVQSIWWAGLVTRHVMLVLLTKHLTLLPEQITVIFWAHLKWYQCISASRQEMWWRIGVDLKIWEIEGLGRDIGINPRNNNTTTQRREKAVGGECYLEENPLTLNEQKNIFWKLNWHRFENTRKMAKLATNISWLVWRERVASLTIGCTCDKTNFPKILPHSLKAVYISSS